MGIRYKGTSERVTLCERKPIMLLLVLGAAAIQALEWLPRGGQAAVRSVLGRWSRGARRTKSASAPGARRAAEAPDHPGWPDADEVEAALEDLRRRAA